MNLIERIGSYRKRKIYQKQLLIYRCDNILNLEVPEPRVSLEIEEVDPNNIGEIAELSKLGDDNQSEAKILQKIKEGWICFAARHHSEIVAFNWMLFNSFVDSYLKFRLNLFNNEAYSARGWSASQLRGKGIFSQVMKYSLEETFKKYGKNVVYGIVTIDNKSQRRCLEKTGWFVAGLTGFIEIYGIRLGYLYGRKAFVATRKRAFLLRNNNSEQL